MVIKYISFDLDNTLVSKRFDDLIWFREIPFLYARKHGLFFEEAFKIVTDEYDKFKGQACWTDMGWWFKHFELQHNWEDIVEEICHEIKLFDDTIPTLKLLSKKYKLIIVSASDRKFLNRKVKLEGLEDYFVKIISTTTDLGCVNKTKDTYLKVLSLMGVSNKEVIHIGDSAKSDYLNPELAGIKSYLLMRDKIEFHEKDSVFNDAQRKAIELNIPKERIVSSLTEFSKCL